jgi:hypothetical protein
MEVGDIVEFGETEIGSEEIDILDDSSEDGSNKKASDMLFVAMVKSDISMSL